MVVEPVRADEEVTMLTSWPEVKVLAAELISNILPVVMPVACRLISSPPEAIVPLELKLKPVPVVNPLTSIFIKLPVDKVVDCKSITPAVFPPLPRVVAVLLVKDKEATVFDASVKLTAPPAVVRALLVVAPETAPTLIPVLVVPAPVNAPTAIPVVVPVEVAAVIFKAVLVVPVPDNAPILMP